MRRLSGFSLMEMMIVLTIVAIVAAVSAPMVNKKMVSSNSSTTPWISNGNLISYSRGPVVIGTADQVGNAQLSIRSANPHIAFSSNAGSNMFLDTRNNNVWLANTSNESATSSVVIGSGSLAYATNDISIGTNAKSGFNSSIAIGNGAVANFADYSTAMGYDAQAKYPNSTAIGAGAHATNSNSTAIGAGAKTTADNQIRLGTANDTVYIPGNLIIDKTLSVGFGYNDASKEITFKNKGVLQTGMRDDGHPGLQYLGRVLGQKNSNDETTVYSYPDNTYPHSDRRLKNVGKAFQGGLAELKKLDLYNYTFKDDKAKTPRVGVMAQDLKKVFPNAVTKGEDGFLRIRMEDMFYAVVNAVKELDTRLNSQNKRIEELEKQNQELMKRIEKLERSK